MKKELFIVVRVCTILVCCTLTCCIHKNQEDTLLIRLRNVYEENNDRNNADYIQLWINDSLLFSGTYYTDFLDDPVLDQEYHVGRQRIEDFRGMKLCSINKRDYLDSIRIRLRLVALDDSLFWKNRRVIDTVFTHRIDNIPEMAISLTCRGLFFQVKDSINDPMYWYYQ